MKTVLVVTADSALQSRLLRNFASASVFVAATDADALKTLRIVDVDVVFRDSARPAADLHTFVARVKDVRPSALVVAIAPPEDATDSADISLPAGFSQRDLEAAVRQVGDRRRLLHEIATLRSQAAGPAVREGPPAETIREPAAFARILTEFTRVLAAGFDLPRTLEMFLDAIGELLRPSRSALLLLDETRQTYRVSTHRALAPQIVSSVRLNASDGLPRWLASQGRPARLHDLSDPEVARELTLLGGVVAVPLLTHGDLVAILVVGQPVAGGAYGRPEMEILFDLSTHLATAVRDITLHHQLHHEKEFNERILSHMSSGVVTIGRDEKVGTFNRRAEEIQLPLGGLWLEVSTYPIRGDEATPLGAVLVLEDRTAQKELAARKRQAEESQLLARVIARIADEIKNPLVSINTFVELIDERYDDPDFRKLFSSVVRRDVRRLVQVFEKLAGLVSEGELNFSTVDVHAVIDEVVTAVELSDEGLGKRLNFDVTRDARPQMVRVDAAQLRKSLSYLVWYLAHNSPGEDAKVTLSVGRHAGPDEPEAVRIIIGSRTAAVPADKLGRLFDPVQMVQESLIDVGPAVSQRLIEAQGGRLQFRQGRHELAFHISLTPVE